MFVSGCTILGSVSETVQPPVLQRAVGLYSSTEDLLAYFHASVWFLAASSDLLIWPGSR